MVASGFDFLRSANPNVYPESLPFKFELVFFCLWLSEVGKRVGTTLLIKYPFYTCEDGN